MTELEALAADARGYAARMAQAPCVAHWQDRHPDAAARHHLPDLAPAGGEKVAPRRHLEAMLDGVSEHVVGDVR